eukprot:1145922-Pelagomonas_calceolata.AAC.2
MHHTENTLAGAERGPEDGVSLPASQGPCPLNELKLEAHIGHWAQQEAMTDAAVPSFPWPRGHFSPSLLPQSYQVKSEEPIGTENTQGGAEMSQIPYLKKERGVSTLRAWCGLPPAPSGPVPRQGGTRARMENILPGMSLSNAVCTPYKNYYQTKVGFCVSVGHCSQHIPSPPQPSMQDCSTCSEASCTICGVSWSAQMQNLCPFE